MQLSESKIREIMRKYGKEFEDLEYYDKTREKLWGRARIDLTLDKRIIRRLKEISREKKKPVSRIIEEAVGGL